MSGVSFNLGCMDISCVRIGGRATCSVMRGSSSHVSFCTASFLIDCVAAVSLPRFLRPLDASSHHVRRTYQVSLPATKCLASTCGAVRWAMWRRERGSRPHCHRASSTSVNKPHHALASHSVYAVSSSGDSCTASITHIGAPDLRFSSCSPSQSI